MVLRSAAGEKLDSILALMRRFLTCSVESVENAGLCCERLPMDADQEEPSVPGFFPWPEHSLHVLSLLQDGFVDDPSRLPLELRQLSAMLIRSAVLRGRLPDKRIAIQFSGNLLDSDLVPLLRLAVALGSSLVDDAAYWQIRALSSLPEDLALWIRFTLLCRAANGQLWDQRRTIFAFLSSVRDGGKLRSGAKLLCHINRIDSVLHGCVLAIIVMSFSLGGVGVLLVTAGLLLSILIRVLFWRQSYDERTLRNIQRPRLRPQTVLVQREMESRRFR